jgi:hypothetical protein
MKPFSYSSWTNFTRKRLLIWTERRDPSGGKIF